MHPTVKILGLICLGVVLNKLKAFPLLLVFAVIAIMACYLGNKAWLGMLARMRWLFLSIFIIYGLATPGEYLSWLPIALGVSYEGLLAGAIQIMRLATMLGTIVILMATTVRADLISGFYTILMPLKVFHLKPERFAARLCLTLQYLEDVQKVKRSGANRSWKQLFDMNIDLHTSHKAQVIELQTYTYKALDFVGLLMMLIVIGVAWI